MSTQAKDAQGFKVPHFTPGTVQTVTVGAASAATTNAVGSSTTLVRLVSDTDCHYVVADAPTATATDTFLPANVVEWVRVTGSEKVAFIQNAAGGTAYVTEAA